jgi:hypothetical protein
MDGSLSSEEECVGEWGLFEEGERSQLADDYFSTILKNPTP